MSRRTLRRLAPFVVLTVVFAALLYRAEHRAETGISQVDRHITEVTSPCLRYGPGSRQCKRSFEAAVATIDHAEACAVLRKAGLKVESCRGARLAEERHRAPKPAPTTDAVAPPEGGGPTSSPPTGSSQPGRHEGGPSGTDHPSHPHAPSVPHQSGGEGGSSGGEAPAASPPAPPSESSSGTSSSSTTTERVESTTVEERTPSPEAEAPAPVRQGAGALLESVGGVVEETGGTVNEVGGGVTESTCSLAKLLCHE